jgi:hypothetical protein
MDVTNLAPETLTKMIADCAKFQAENSATWDGQHVGSGDETERAGHDFWLTRNGHGCGFWDGDWSDEVEQVLTDAAHAYGETDLYIGDDGLIYSS